MALKARVPAPGVVPVDVLGNIRLCMAHALISTQVHALVFHASPQPLDKHIISPRAAAIHGKLGPTSEHRLGELLSGELAALIGVDNLRDAEASERLLDDLHRVMRLKRGGRLVGEHTSNGHIHHRREIDKAVRHRNVEPAPAKAGVVSNAHT